MLPWTIKYKDCHITVKELGPIVIAGVVRWEQWREVVMARSDNSDYWGAHQGTPGQLTW